MTWHKGTLKDSISRALYRKGQTAEVYAYIPERNEAMKLTKAEAKELITPGEREPSGTQEFYEHRWRCAPQNQSKKAA